METAEPQPATEQQPQAWQDSPVNAEEGDAGSWDTAARLSVTAHTSTTQPSGLPVVRF